MNFSSLLSAVPSGIFVLAIAFLVVATWIIRDALQSKGDVHAKLAIGKSTFELDAKDKRNPL